VSVKLYGVPASHPVLAAQLMLERKGIDYRRVDMVPTVHTVQVRALGFPGRTVPALRFDGERVQGSRRISRFLEEVRPEPSLFPADSERRRAVEEAERWGEDVLQDATRRIILWAMWHDRGSAGSFVRGSKLPFPDAIATRTTTPIVWSSIRRNGATDDAVRVDLEALPDMLDRVDAFVGDGTIGAEEPNAADYQIASSLRMLMACEDLRPAIEGRPAGELALRVVPRYAGRVGRAFPDDWLARLRAG
jgi:glutathione S-transferase